MSHCRIYVGHIPYEARERDVERFFKGYGRIRDVLIKRGYAFVELDDSRDADDAVHELNGKTMMGMRVTVEIAKSRPWRAGDTWSSRRRGHSRSRSRSRRRSRSRHRSRSRTRSPDRSRRRRSPSKSRSRTPVKRERSNTRDGSGNASPEYKKARSASHSNSRSPPPKAARKASRSASPADRRLSTSPEAIKKNRRSRSHSPEANGSDRSRSTSHSPSRNGVNGKKNTKSRSPSGSSVDSSKAKRT